jgi:transcriptional regulator with XRE-family HTH domain
MGRKRAEVDTSTYSGRIAARVRELRERKGYTVEKLAEKVGVDIKAMYAYEQNARTIPPDLYPKVWKALGCSHPDQFFPHR